MAVTNKRNQSMKTKNKFVCANCGKQFKSEMGLQVHSTRMHPGKYISSIRVAPNNKGGAPAGVDVEDDEITGVKAWKKKVGWPILDTKGKITDAQTTPLTPAMMDGTNYASPEPTHYSILKDFEDAVRDDEMRGAGHPDLMEITHEDYLRAKRLLALRIRILMHKAEKADWLERELMS